MNIALDVDEALLAELRADPNLSGSDKDRVSQALRAYLRAQAGKGLIAAGGQSPDMLEIPRR
jgi:Arc/MetJ family transcription regulator